MQKSGAKAYLVNTGWNGTGTVSYTHLDVYKRQVHRDDLFGGNAVAVDDDVAREVRNGDHAVGGVHAGPLDGVDLRVDLSLIHI